MSRSISILILCGALVSCATVQPATEQEVRQASEQFFAARDRGDAAAFAAQFTEDGIFMIPGVADAAGRNAIEELAKKRFGGLRTSDLNIQRREIDVHGDLAHELAWYSETNRGQGPAMRMSGRYLIVWKRGSANALRVHRYVFAYSGAEAL